MAKESRKYYYWIVAKAEDGKIFLILGSDKNEGEARSRGLECLQGIDFEIAKLPTRTTSIASQMVRGKRLENTHSLSRARQRLGHDKSLDRYKRRIRRHTEWQT